MVGHDIIPSSAFGKQEGCERQDVVSLKIIILSSAIREVLAEDYIHAVPIDQGRQFDRQAGSLGRFGFDNRDTTPRVSPGVEDPFHGVYPSPPDFSFRSVLYSVSKIDSP